MEINQDELRAKYRERERKGESERIMKKLN